MSHEIYSHWCRLCWPPDREPFQPSEPSYAQRTQCRCRLSSHSFLFVPSLGISFNENPVTCKADPLVCWAQLNHMCCHHSWKQGGTRIYRVHTQDSSKAVQCNHHCNENVILNATTSRDITDEYISLIQCIYKDLPGGLMYDCSLTSIFGINSHRDRLRGPQILGSCWIWFDFQFRCSVNSWQAKFPSQWA